MYSGGVNFGLNFLSVAELPDNVVVDYPRLENSIYDLFEIIDLHLASQTTTGCESAILGVNDIGSVTGLGNYPIQTINPMPANQTEYFRELDRQLTGDCGRSLETARKAFEWYLFLHTQPLFCFDTHGFWNRAQSHALTSKVVRKLKQSLGLQRHSLKSYLDRSTISPAEAKMFLAVVERGKEILEVREQLEPEYPRNLDTFQRYLRGLFSAYSGVDTESCDRFRRDATNAGSAPAPGECVFVESDTPYAIEAEEVGGGLRVTLPRWAKSSRALAHFLTQ